MMKTSCQSNSVMKSMPVTVLFMAQTPAKHRSHVLLRSILNMQGILINKN